MFISTEMENGNKPKWEDEKLSIEEERFKASSLADELRMKGGSKV